MPTAHLTLIGKPGCHLCDDARDVIESVVGKVREEPNSPEIVLDERSILDDAELHDRYVEEIPVLLINGTVHNYWRIDPLRLRTALLELS
jgi:glutaredoxin